MRVILEILGFFVGLIIICILIEIIFGVHIGIADLFDRMTNELGKLFSDANMIA